MAYGIETYDASGTLLLDNGQKITRLRYSTFEENNTSDSVTLNDIAGIDSIQFGIYVGNEEDGIFEVTRSDTTISWSLGNEDALIVVFLYS